MDLNRLRHATRAEHEATEAVMPLMQAGLTREFYARVLGALFPIVAGWESWAAEAAPADVRPLLERRRRTPLLTADLAAFGMKAPSEEGWVSWAQVICGDGAHAGADNVGRLVASLLGGVYVMEGSTLGGRFLARHVEQQLALEPGQGVAYFHGHGEQTGEMWREVRQRIEAVPEMWEGEVISAACRTFIAFREALQVGLTPSDLHETGSQDEQ